MDDSIISDVKELLDKEKGDKIILKQILRACENNEVLSNYERNYVKKLSERYLGRIPPIEQKINFKEKPFVDLLSDEASNSKNEIIQTNTQQILKSEKKGRKILIGIGAVAIIAIIIAGFSFSGMFDGESIFSENNSIDSNIFSINTDLKSYKKNDIVSIFGTSKTLGTVIISIENKNGQVIWSENIPVKDNGRFSTLTVAGGKGWEDPGTFIITAEIGPERESNSFSFTK